MQLLEEIWPVYEEAFPAEERRSIKQQKAIMKNPCYNLKILHSGVKTAGFIGFWDFSNFLFIEHFAFKKRFRCQGLGTKTLQKIKALFKKKIIIEVEKPETFIAKRRIKFYERLGFKLNNYDYLQPAYNKTQEPVPLLIMSYPEKMDTEDFIKIKDMLYHRVYGISY